MTRDEAVGEAFRAYVVLTHVILEHGKHAGMRATEINHDPTAFHRALRERGHLVVSVELIDAVREFLAAGENAVNASDDVAAMLRFGEAEKRLRAMLEAVR